MSRVSSVIPMTVALLVAWASQATAQSVRVRVVEAQSGAPVGGALVALLASDGNAVAEQLTPPSGTVTLRAPAAGTYRVRVRRIAFEPARSDPLTLAAGATASLDMRVSSARVILSGVEVSAAGGSCERDPAQASRTAALWEEVRKALASTELTRAQRLVPVEMRTFERRLSTRFRVEHEEMSEPQPSTSRPFFARPAAELRRTGYVARSDGQPLDFSARDALMRELTYYGPDATVILSEEFLADHCFDLRAGSGATQGLVGLAFEPVRERLLPDVKGVLWVDAPAAELRLLEFTYTNWSPPAIAPGAGGRVLFERLEGGAWIVKEWAIRMPIFAQEQYAPFNVRLRGYLETGGEAGVRLTTVASRVEPGVIDGTIYDSLTSAPLAAATIRLPGSGFTARSDAGGRFRVTGVPAGTYALQASHPVLDSLGMHLGDRLAVEAGETTHVALAIPSYRQFRAACDTMAPDKRGIVVGSVRDAEEERALAGAAAVFWWVEVDTAGGRTRVGPRQVRAITDDAGVFRACGLPVGQMVMAQAYGGGFATGSIQLMLDDRAVAGRDFLLSMDSTAVAGASSDSLELEPHATPRTARLAVMVVDTAGKGIAGARAAVDGVDQESTTEASGRAVLASLPPGTQMLDLRAPGYAPVRRVVQLRPNREVVDTVRVERVQTLAAVEVRGRRQPRLEIRRDIESRKSRLGGYLVTPDELARLGDLPIYMLLDRIPQLRVAYKPDVENRDRPERRARPAGGEAQPGPTGRRGSDREGRAASALPPELPALLKPPATEWYELTEDTGLRFSMPGANGKRCNAHVWIDGKLARPEALYGLQAHEIYAIEVYMRDLDVPVKFRKSMESCGAIIVWTTDTTG